MIYYLPDRGKAEITAANNLVASGSIPLHEYSHSIEFFKRIKERDLVVELINSHKLVEKHGASYHFADLNMVCWN